MDKIIDSRINRSLVIHGLENLVFEKRQRKSIQQFPLILPTASPQLKTQIKKGDQGKKEIRLAFRAQKISKNKLKALPMRTQVSKKLIHKMKQSKKKVEQINEQPFQGRIQDTIKETNAAPKVSRKSVHNDKKIDTAKLEISYNVTILNTIKQKESGQEMRSSESKSRNSNKRGRGRPKKQANEPIEIVQQQPPKHQQTPIQSVEQVQQVSPIKQPAVVASYQIIKSQMNIQQASEKDAVSPSDKINPRDRRAKLNPYKSYNENEEENYSEESYQQSKGYRKKKRIGKSYKGKSNSKPYSLNRIFRKEAKRHFATFTLDVDLNKASFANFVKDFGTFDLIHFSLPISYLYLFPEIVNIIEKGFIFVWVEQGETQIGYHLLNRWGFDIIDQIIWIKSNEDENKIEADNVDLCNSIIDTNQEIAKPSKPLFINSKSTCLVGYKCPLGNKAQYRTKVSNNIIFAKSLPGRKKPAEIYQIADLMMPGAKKLEFGGDSQKGWLNLKHHEKTLNRCNNCLREQNLYILAEEKQKPVQCKKCIVDLVRDDLDTESIDEITKQYQTLSKIKISQVNYSQQSTLACRLCKKKNKQLQFSGILLTNKNEQGLCLDCAKSNLKVQGEEVKVLTQKRKYYLKSQLTCSDCGVLNIYDIYFQCSKCKNHILCKACFWRNKTKIQENAEEEVKKTAKKQVMHEWKLKFIKNYPLMRFTCYGCKIDLSIPFWCCETCQNWFWCGKCNRGNSTIHPHYQTADHVEYIMI